jgi:hypothetical protein
LLIIFVKKKPHFGAKTRSNFYYFLLLNRPKLILATEMRDGETCVAIVPILAFGINRFETRGSENK